VDKKSKRMIINTIKKDKQDPVKINKIISIVIENGGIQYAENKMHEYKNLALQELDQLPNSPAKESFIGLIHYSINRKK
jgi:octaprenyl-diphosphate synthase